ncbi:MAG: hypothetical protein ABSH11_05445 [Verrucomicrobiota bacterium]|jgi:hypothetical protein
MDEFELSLPAFYARQTTVLSMAHAIMRGNVLIYSPCPLYRVTLRAGALKTANATPNLTFEAPSAGRLPFVTPPPLS